LFRGDEAYYPTVPRDSRVEEGHERQRGDEVDDDDVDSVHDVDARQWLAQRTPGMSTNTHDVDARQRPALEAKIVAPESTPVVTGSAKKTSLSRVKIGGLYPKDRNTNSVAANRQPKWKSCGARIDVGGNRKWKMPSSKPVYGNLDERGGAGVFTTSTPVSGWPWSPVDDVAQMLNAALVQHLAWRL